MKVTVIGIGPGHPDQITVQAVKAMNAHQVILLPTKEGTTTGDTRRLIAERHLVNPERHSLIDLPMPKVSDRPGGDYVGSVHTFRQRQAMAVGKALDELETDAVALLAWGCPTLFDGTIEAVRAYPGVELEVIPGVTSVSALAARHAVVLTEVGQSVLITTGRQLKDGIPPGHGTIADMVDANGHIWNQDPKGWTAYWGAFVGLENEALDHGPLAEVRERIQVKRAALADEYGWLFDLTILRATHEEEGKDER